MEELQKLNRYGNRRGMNPKSLENIAIKSHPGNHHAKKEFSVTPVLQEMANEIADDRFLEAYDKGKGLTWRQATALRMWRDAVRGKYAELLDRTDGKVTLLVGPAPGEPFMVKVIEKIKDYGSS